MMKLDRRKFIISGSAAAAACTMPLKSRAWPRKDPDRYFILPEAGERLVLEDPPDRIVEDGLIRAGLFKAPLREMNLLDSNALAGRARTRLGLPKLMEWVGAGMAHPEWYFGFIIVDAKTASLAVLYGFKRSTGAYFSHDHFGRASRVRVSRSIWKDATYIQKPGFNMQVRHCLERGFHEINIEIEPTEKDPPVRAELVWQEDLERIQPLVMMTPLGARNFIYNHKAQMPVQGYMKIGDEKIEFDPGRDIANMDEVRGYSGLASGISYRWFNFGGIDERGRIIGLNASESPNKKDEFWSENCIWSGKRLSMVGKVCFRTDPSDVMKPWSARDDKGMVDVTFYPEGGKEVKAGPLGKYYQKCGRFQGTLVDHSGEKHKINDYYGCAEIMDVL